MKIIHLEDHLSFAEGFSVLMRRYRPSVQIIGTSNTEAALQLLEEHADIDLIIIDLNMPGLHGQTFIEGLNQRNLYIPFLVLSATDDIRKIESAINSGASGFAPKTDSMQSILTVIDQIMLGHTAIPKNILDGIARLNKNSVDKKQELIKQYQLSERQLDVLGLLQQGYSNQEIASVLNISINTIKIHVRTLCETFSAKNRTECVFLAEKSGLLD